MTQRMVMTPPMMFTQRLTLYFNSRDRKTIAIEISVTIAAINKNSGVICVPSTALPATICFRNPGYMKEKISAKAMLNMMKIHNVESLAFISSIWMVLLLVFIVHSF